MILYEWKASRLSKQSRGERIEYAMQMKWKRPLQGYLSVMLMFLFSNRLIELEWNRFKK